MYTKHHTETIHQVKLAFVMFNILNFFKKSTNSDVASGASSQIDAARSWFEERYETTLIQRNILALIAACCIGAIAIAVVAVTKISLSREFDPFVIQIEDTTGIARVVNPVSLDVLVGKDELSKYFLKKYVTARETYNPVDFDTFAKKTIRLMSTSQIYRTYINFIKDKANDPTISYGQKNTTYLNVRSWSKLSDKQYMLRFSLTETAGERKTFNKIAVIEFGYIPMELTDEERDINPVGFQVLGYRVDDDAS
ncbi:MAG: type secretion system protein VirB8 [Pseudomonadota bacterium]|jgi:type IV secretion system protein VirB8